MYEAHELGNTSSPAAAAIKLIEQRLDVQGRCLVCNEEFDRNVSGRPKIYCSNRCKQRAKRARKKLSDIQAGSAK